MWCINIKRLRERGDSSFPLITLSQVLISLQAENSESSPQVSGVPRSHLDAKWAAEKPATASWLTLPPPYISSYGSDAHIPAVH